MHKRQENVGDKAQTLAASPVAEIDTEAPGIDAAELAPSGVIYGTENLELQVRSRIARTAARRAEFASRREAAVDATWAGGGIGGLDESLLETLATARV